MKKLQWYTADSAEVYPNFHPSRGTMYAPKRNGIIETDHLFNLTETGNTSTDTTYWIEDIYGRDDLDPDYYVGVEIVELYLREVLETSEYKETLNYVMIKSYTKEGKLNKASECREIPMDKFTKILDILND